MKDITVNRFRAARGKRLAKHIESISAKVGRKIDILDVGGREDYWQNVRTDHVRKIVIMNYEASELNRSDKMKRGLEGVEIQFIVGDARNIGDVGEFDLLHANSVIEHVGAWWDMQAMAKECRRVCGHGWVQTPAFEFPIEPHYRLPFVHWLGLPIRRKLLFFSPKYRKNSVTVNRMHVDRINLLSSAEFKALFEGVSIWREKVAGLTKSYVAYW